MMTNFNTQNGHDKTNWEESSRGTETAAHHLSAARKIAEHTLGLAREKHVSKVVWERRLCNMHSTPRH